MTTAPQTVPGPWISPIEPAHIISVSGRSVNAVEVEKALCRHPKVAMAAVIGVPDEVRGEAVKAFIVLHDGGSVEQILAWLRKPASRLAHTQLPKHIDFGPSLPETRRSRRPRRRQRHLTALALPASLALGVTAGNTCERY
jgi:acyl-coenzyme A synthetase/AMP-(fatty) acid ligase